MAVVNSSCMCKLCGFGVCGCNFGACGVWGMLIYRDAGVLEKCWCRGCFSHLLMAQSSCVLALGEVLVCVLIFGYCRQCMLLPTAADQMRCCSSEVLEVFFFDHMPGRSRSGAMQLEQMGVTPLTAL